MEEIDNGLCFKTAKNVPIICNWSDFHMAMHLKEVAMADVLNVALEIEKLDELRTRKVITDEEFADRKAKLLAPARPGNLSKQKRPGTILAVSELSRCRCW